MKKCFVAAFLSLIIFSHTSCLKDNTCTNLTVQTEAGTIESYALANGINATAHSSGIYYEIISAGSGAPNHNSRIFVSYTGKLLDGTVFDQVSDHTLTGWTLGGLIPGWQIGLPLIGEGGRIRLLIPSSLGYGCRGNGPIPGNQILDFDVQLIDVQ